MNKKFRLHRNFFPANLKYLRVYNNFTQDVVSNQLGIRRSTWGTYEAGFFEPTILRMLDICSFFNTTIEQLIAIDLKQIKPVLRKARIGKTIRSEKFFLPVNLAYLRKRDGLLLRDMKNYVNVKQGTWYNYENGITDPKIEKILDISARFNVTINELFYFDLSALYPLAQTNK